MAGTVLVNLGDLMQRWTADRLLSTVGQVAVNMYVVLHVHRFAVSENYGKISWHETKKFVKICCFVLLPETSSRQSRFCGRLHWSITTSAMLTCSVCPSHEGMPCWVYRRFEQVPANISRRLFERKIWRDLREKYCIGTTFGILEPDGHLRRICTIQYMYTFATL